MGGQGGDRRAAGWRVSPEWELGQGGRNEGPFTAGGAGTRGLAQPRSAPAGAQIETRPLWRSIEQRTDPRVAEAFCGVPTPYSQESGEKVLAPQEARPLIFSPPCSAVTQPRCPRPAERGRQRETDDHLPAVLAVDLSGPPPRPTFSLGAPSQSGLVPSGWSRCAQDFPPLRAELSSQDQAGAGPGPNRPAPPSDPPPSPEVPPRWDIFDVTES